MKQVALFEQATQHLTKLVEQIKDDQWDNPTPCTDWNVHDLLNHLASEHLWMPPLFAGETIAEVGSRFDGDVLGADPKGVLRKAVEESVVVVSEPKSLDKTVQLSFGETPGREYLDQMLLDTIVHTWDLAAGLEVNREIDPELLQAAWEYLEPRAEAWRQAGAFGPAFELKDDQKDDLQNRLLAVTGRNPDWQPA